jgi:hypothetical protein
MYLITIYMDRNLLKRELFMKKLAFFQAVLVVVLALAACGGGNTEIWTGPPTSNVQVYKISDGSAYTGSGAVTDDNSLPWGTITGGKLTLSYPDVSSSLGPVPMPSGITIVPPAAEGYIPDEFDLSGPDVWFGSESGDDFISYVYVDRNATVTGFGLDGGTTLNMNLSLRQGWNLVWAHYEGASTIYTTSDLTGIPKDSAKWYIGL